MSALAIVAYFAVFFIGLYVCVKEAKLALISSNMNGLTVFERRAYIIKSGVLSVLTLMSITGLLIASKGV